MFNSKLFYYINAMNLLKIFIYGIFNEVQLVNHQRRFANRRIPNTNHLPEFLVRALYIFTKIKDFIYELRIENQRRLSPKVFCFTLGKMFKSFIFLKIVIKFQGYNFRLHYNSGRINSFQSMLNLSQFVMVSIIYTVVTVKSSRWVKRNFQFCCELNWCSNKRSVHLCWLCTLPKRKFLILKLSFNR